MKIEIRPIETKKWHGKEKEENFSNAKTLTALADAATMTYATGLTDEDRERLAKELPDQDLSENFNPEVPHPFWDSKLATLKLENSTMFLETDRTFDFLKWKIAKASRFIANSVRDFDQGLYPEATHVIFNEAEESDVKAKRIEIKNETIKLVDDLSTDRKVQILLILTGKNMRGQSNSFITVKMDELVTKNAKDVLRYIKLEDTSQIANHALVLEALQKSVLKKAGHKITYHESVLGTDELDVATYLGEDENQDLRIRLMKAIN